MRKKLLSCNTNQFLNNSVKDVAIIQSPPMLLSREFDENVGFNMLNRKVIVVFVVGHLWDYRWRH